MIMTPILFFFLSNRPDMNEEVDNGDPRIIDDGDAVVGDHWSYLA